MFDTYVQKSNNLQVWNEELSPTRRYVIIRVTDDDTITRVKVVTGDTLAELDTTGTLTQKYQARLITGDIDAELIAEKDTALLQPFVRSDIDLKTIAKPTNQPAAGKLLSIKDVFERPRGLVGDFFQTRVMTKNETGVQNCTGLCASTSDTQIIMMTGSFPTSATS